MSNIKINPRFVTNIRLDKEYKNEFYRYFPAYEKKVLKFNLKKLFHYEKIYVEPYIRFITGDITSFSEIEKDCVLRDDIIYSKAKVVIFVSGQEDPYIIRYNTNSEAEEAFNKISEEVKKKANKKSKTSFDNFIEI